jgi:hypothetical protein
MELIKAEQYTHVRCLCRDAWYKDGELHRDGDQPAIIFDSGRKEWYANGIPYRENGLPHAENLDGTREWYEVSRENGRIVWDTAIYETNTWKGWYSEGVPHRDERDSEGLLLPALIRYNGIDEYYIHGKLVDRHGTPLRSN